MIGGNRETIDAEYVPTWPNNPEVDEYYRDAHEKRQEPHPTGRGPVPLRTLDGLPQHVLPRRPAIDLRLAPGRADEDGDVALVPVDKKAPEAAKDALRHFGMRYSGPGGMTEQDDAENWNYATAASKGTIASRYPFNYEMGIGHVQAGRRPRTAP